MELMSYAVYKDGDGNTIKTAEIADKYARERIADLEANGGGTGGSTGTGEDPAEAATYAEQAKESAEQAAASAEAAATHEANAADSAEAAEAAASTATDEADRALACANEANAAAQVSGTDAANAAAGAEASEAAAKDAQAAQSAAEAAKTEAQGAADSASESKTAAADSAATAASKATEAANSATAAAEAKTAAESAQEAAETAANTASQQAGFASGFADDATTARDEAQGFKSQAATSATNAADAAATATEQAGYATNSAHEALQGANQANASAEAAAASETNAAASATEAAEQAEEASSSRASAYSFMQNASVHADNAAASKNAAAASADAAADSAEAAQAAADSINGGAKAYTVPDYWESEVASVVEQVTADQIAGGADIVNFCWFSDLHFVTSSQHTANVGNLCAAVMDRCGVPFTLFTGDTTSATVFSKESDLIGHLDGAMESLAPIGHKNLLLCVGNHDDVYGSSGSVDYVNKVSSAKMWYHLHRSQAQDMRRHYGPHGTYFYLDNDPQRVRFVCLNSHYYDGEGWSDGTSKAMTAGFGAEQLAWLENEALDVPSGYGVIIATHVPPTAKAINGNTFYLSQIPDGNDLRSIISNTAANVIGVFCGHCHADAIVTGDLPCPIVTITSAVNTPYDADWSTRVAGTATETALDVVTINKKTREIKCRRIGYGSDRSCSYAKQRKITQNLTFVTSSNAATSIADGSTFAATLTPTDNYAIESVKVTMGGEDITATAYSGGVVNIANVSGDIVITAVAVSSTNTVPITWKDGYNATYNVGQTCTVSSNASYITTEEIPVAYGKTYTMNVTSTAADFGFRWIGVDSSGVITEVDNRTNLGTGAKTLSWTPTKENTVGLRIRSYSSVAAFLTAVKELEVS